MTRPCYSGVIMTPVTQHTNTTVHTRVFCPLCLESQKKSSPSGSELPYTSGVSWWPQGLSQARCCYWQPSPGLLVLQFPLIPLKIIPDGKRSHTPQRRDQTPSGYGTTGDRSAAWLRTGRQQGVLKSLFKQSKTYPLP